MQAMAGGAAEDFLVCRRYLRHYENFHVVSWLVPKDLRPHFWALYAFCRGVDDLGDEHRGDRLKALDAFERELFAAARGEAQEPVFRALGVTIRRFGLPLEEFRKLIDANRIDQRQTTYRTFAELRDYCRHSADPVGRLVLSLFGIRDAHRWQRSDDICTGLQLANFWQDVERDLAMGRVYVPEEDMVRFGVSREDFSGRRRSSRVCQLMEFECGRAQVLFDRGRELERRVPRRLGLQLKLYRLGGQAVLDAIRRQGYDPFAGRPTLSRLRKARIAVAVLLGSGG